MPRNGKPFSRLHVFFKSMTIGSHSAKKEQGFLLRSVAGRFRWNRLAARLQAVIEAEAPLGYEDETGFHFQDENRSRSFRYNHANDAWEALQL